MKRAIIPFVQIPWNRLFVIVHRNCHLPCGILFRIVHTSYLPPATLLKTATVAMETQVLAACAKWPSIEIALGARMAGLLKTDIVTNAVLLILLLRLSH